MAKSLRSKIKRKFRTELRKRVGVPHQAKMEAKIQENLKHALEAQGMRPLLLLNGVLIRLMDSFFVGIVHHRRRQVGV